MELTGVSFVIGSYLVGSIPFGLLIAKHFYHIDIRAHGSGNPGATNVGRVLGIKPGLTTLALDVAKGFFPVFYVMRFLPYQTPWAIATAFAAIVGHNWSPFLKFKGGKGVATSAGVFFALVPKHMTISLTGFLLVFLVSRRVSVGSVFGAIALLISSFVFPTELILKVLIIAASAMILIKHIPNMKRIADGSEPKVKFK